MDHRKSASVASVISTASSTPNLAPFEGLTETQVGFVDSIIERVPSSVTTFVPVFKAYQDEFEERGLSATDDQFYYNLLLKLGMIRAENWQERWKLVKTHYDYASESSIPEEGVNEKDTTILASTANRRPYLEDDAFTLYSQPEMPRQHPPPSYASKMPSISREIRQPVISQRTKGSSSSAANRDAAGKDPASRIPRTSSTGKVSSAFRKHSRPTSIASGVPPSYRTGPQTTGEAKPRPKRSSTTLKDDADTWKIIEMERDADIFRKESLLSRCLDVWVKGLRWIEDTSTQLDNARTELLLRSVITRWREKCATAIDADKRADNMNHARILHSTFSKWRAQAWKRRKSRWNAEMRQKMETVYNRVQMRYLRDALTKWKQAHSLLSASQNHDRFLLRSALQRWNGRLHQTTDLNYKADQFLEQSSVLLLEKYLNRWKQQIHLNSIEKIVRRHQNERIKWEALRRWQQKTKVHSVSGGFSDFRIMKHSLHKWIQRHRKLQKMERRAIVHHNQPLVRAVVRIWLAQTRMQRYERERDQRIKAQVLQVWVKRKEQVNSYEHKVAMFRKKVDKRLASHYLKVWTQRLAYQLRLQRRSQRTYETALKARIFFAWRVQLRAHAKAVKQAKLARQVFLQRMVWQRWTQRMAERTRERNARAFQNKKLQGIIRLWSTKAKRQRALRRKGDVVMEASQLRLSREFLHRWTLRVVFLKDREYCVIQQRKEAVLRFFFEKWASAFNRNAENTSLMQSFRDVRQEETMRRVLSHWLHSTRRKQFLAEREEELRRRLLLHAYEKWREKYLEIELRPAELDVLLQSQANLLFKFLRRWESRTQSIPAIRFHAQHTRAKAWRVWKEAMPKALKLKEAREYDRRITLGRMLLRWRERYKSKVSMKAFARARYLRLPSAPPKTPSSSRAHGSRPRVGSESARSVVSDRDITTRRVEPAVPPKAESSRAPSPSSTKSSFHGLSFPARRRIDAPGPSIVRYGSRPSLDERRRESWDGYGITRARARAAFSAGSGKRTRDSGSDIESD